MATHPEILWAQRSSATDEGKNLILLTINLPDIVEEDLDLQISDTSISFKATAGTPSHGLKQYECLLTFFEEIVASKSQKSLTSRRYFLKLFKKEKKAEYWPRLTQEKRPHNVKTHFDQWVDEDEQEGEPMKMDEEFPDPIGDMGGGGMDFEKMMANMGSANKPPVSNDAGSDEEDEDDEGPPPLEDAA